MGRPNPKAYHSARAATNSVPRELIEHGNDWQSVSVLVEEAAAALAAQVGSSQSRIAKMEAADRHVGVDWRMRSLLDIEATQADQARGGYRAA